ncbi:hypothetical protein PoB_006629700 [Plakobranchus ocellatus]|uniref:Uncharacterized protein n=1 Tax=Plakobranchus ocellatus TaxID=259542 RepID=A0AAV4D6N4_9GAST|nr:hypothetical protein PoB_006629700 [Plakobranchus ocellatus]
MCMATGEGEGRRDRGEITVYQINRLPWRLSRLHQSPDLSNPDLALKGPLSVTGTSFSCPVAGSVPQSGPAARALGSS